MSTVEKVELEQVPLKTDTDETLLKEGGEAAVEAPVVAEKAPAPKKTWFFTKTEKKKVVEGDEVVEEKEKMKKKCFWQRCSKKTEEGAEECKNEMSIGIDMQMRDEKALNDHVKIQFEDVFGEPDTFHSFDCAWRVNYRVFEFTRTIFYKIFSLLIFLPLSIIFGILFALLSSLNVYFVMPLAKLATIPLAWLSKAWSFLIANIFDPVASSIGLCFSKIHVRKYGINNAPTDIITA